MSKTSFKEYIKQEKVKAESIKNSIDWEKRKKFYLNQLEVLFHAVENFLREYPDIEISKEIVTIEEDYFGEYEVPVLHIQLYAKRASLIPAGTFLIGTPGRADLVGTLETRRIILTGKDEDHPQSPVALSCSWLDEDDKLEEMREQERQEHDFVWKLITNPPKIRYIDLNEDSFLNALQEVFDA